MKYKKTKGNEIKGHLDIFVAENEEEFDGKIIKWNEVVQKLQARLS